MHYKSVSANYSARVQIAVPIRLLYGNLNNSAVSGN